MKKYFVINWLIEEDINRNIMKILVFDDENENNTNKNIYESNEIICPESKENILIKINDYIINLNNCKNGHNINNILLNKYENTQNIDISKIICNMPK